MITVTPTPDNIDSCTACAKPNYIRNEGGPIIPNGVKIFRVAVGYSESSRWITKFCAECLQELNEKIYPVRTGIPMTP